MILQGFTELLSHPKSQYLQSVVLRLIAILLTFVFASACSEDTESVTNNKVCVPGMSIECVGACGQGFQVCNSEGSGYAACMCPMNQPADSGVSVTVDSGTNGSPDAGTPPTMDAGLPPGDDSGVTPTADSGTSSSEDSGTPSSMDSGASSNMDAGSTGSDAGTMMNTDGGVPPVSGPCTDPWCVGTSTSNPNADVCDSAYSRYWPTTSQLGGATRLQRDLSIPGEPVVVDTYTTAEWTGCVRGLSGNACENGQALFTRGSSHDTGCESLIWGGHSDWVAPTAELLYSIFDSYEGSLDPATFPNSADRPLYASYPPSSNNYRLSNNDYIGQLVGGTSDMYSYCVRFPQGVDLRTPVNRCFETTYGQAQEPTVTDLATQTVWTSCRSGRSGATCGNGSAPSRTYQSAVDYCEQLNYAGFTDWTLPTHEHFRSLVNFNSATPGTPNGLFEEIGNRYWTKTYHPKYGYSRATTIAGASFSGSAVNSTSQVLCVREGGILDRNVSLPGTTCREIVESFHEDDYASSMPRFTRNLSVPGEPVVEDAMLGVQWLGCRVGLTGDTCSSGAAQTVTVANIESSCESLNWGGHNDWVAPPMNLLSSFIQRSPTSVPSTWTTEVNNAFVNFTDDPLATANRAVVSNSSVFYYRVFPSGQRDYYGNSNRQSLVCVRSPTGTPLPGARQQCLDTNVWSRNEPVVTDMASGLQWMGCLAGRTGVACAQGSALRQSFSQARMYCSTLNWAGQSGWRLPNQKEFMSIVTENTRGFAFDPNAFSFITNDLVNQTILVDGTWGAPATDGFSYSPSIRYWTYSASSNARFFCVRDL
ncbi:MAG: DUF1566 domain-containing protein [Myxococcota bacterium]|nr:DUF1566 domain-containing protein [Myxococcota bacterium]